MGDRLKEQIKIATFLQRFFLVDFKYENYFCQQTNSLSYDNKKDQNLAFTRLVPHTLQRVAPAAAVVYIVLFKQISIKSPCKR